MVSVLVTNILFWTHTYRRRSVIQSSINSDIDFLNTQLYSNDFTRSSFANHHHSQQTTTSINFHTVEENDEDESSAIFEPEEQRYISTLRTRKSYVPDDFGGSFPQDDTEDPFGGEDERLQQQQQQQQQDGGNLVDYNHENNSPESINNNEPSNRNFIDEDYGGDESYQSSLGEESQQIQSNMFEEAPNENDNFEQEQQQHKSVTPESAIGSKRDETGHKKQYQPWPYAQVPMSNPYQIPIPILPEHTPYGGEEHVPMLQRARTNEALQQLKSDAFNHMEQMLNVNISKTSELIKKKKKKLSKVEKAKLEIKSRQEKFKKLYHPDVKKNKETKKGKGAGKSKEDLSLESDIKKLEKHITDTYHLVKVQKDDKNHVNLHSASPKHPSIANQFKQKEQLYQQFQPQVPPKAPTAILPVDKPSENNNEDEQSLEDQQTQDSLLQDSMKSLEDGWNLDLDTNNDEKIQKGDGEQQPHHFNGKSPNQAMRFTPPVGANVASPFNVNPFYPRQQQQQQQIDPPMLKHQIQPVHINNAKQISKTIKNDKKITTTNTNNIQNSKDQNELNIPNKNKFDNIKPSKVVKTSIQKNKKLPKPKHSHSKKSTKTATIKMTNKKITAAHINNNNNNNKINNNNNKTKQQTKKKSEKLHVQKSTLEESVNQEKEKSIKKLIEKLDAAENIHQGETAGNTRQDTPEILASTNTYGATALVDGNLYPSSTTGETATLSNQSM